MESRRCIREYGRSARQPQKGIVPDAPADLALEGMYMSTSRRLRFRNLPCDCVDYSPDHISHIVEESNHRFAAKSADLVVHFLTEQPNQAAGLRQRVEAWQGENRREGLRLIQAVEDAAQAYRDAVEALAQHGRCYTATGARKD